jgi:hypothetical protein
LLYFFLSARLTDNIHTLKHVSLLMKILLHHFSAALYVYQSFHAYVFMHHQK